MVQVQPYYFERISLVEFSYKLTLNGVYITLLLVLYIITLLVEGIILSVTLHTYYPRKPL